MVGPASSGALVSYDGETSATGCNNSAV
jgi:hypothetical protein